MMVVTKGIESFLAQEIDRTRRVLSNSRSGPLVIHIDYFPIHIGLRMLLVVSLDLVLLLLLMMLLLVVLLLVVSMSMLLLLKTSTMLLPLSRLLHLQLLKMSLLPRLQDSHRQIIPSDIPSSIDSHGRLELIAVIGMKDARVRV